MKNLLQNIILALLLVVIAIPLIIAFLLYVPFEFFRYRRMPYYKEQKVKYTPFITSRMVVRVYNHIAREQLSVEYFSHNGCEYFIQENQVLIPDWAMEDFMQVDGVWFFGSENVTGTPMEEVIEITMESVKPEHSCLPARFLVPSDKLDDAYWFDRVNECPHFYRFYVR